MNEHELCCGTVADKAKLCAEIEQRDLIMAAQQRRIEELRDLLRALADRDFGRNGWDNNLDRIARLARIAITDTTGEKQCL